MKHPYQENRVFEDNMFWLSGLSAIKGLQILKAMDINITELEPYQTYSNPNLPEIVVNDINNALNMGWKVTAPEHTGGLPSIPYIKYDPETGSAGYMIATAAGGYSFDIAPIGHEEDLGFINDIYLEDNIRLTLEIPFPESPYIIAMGGSFPYGIKTTANGPAGSEAVVERTSVIDTDRTHYRQGYWPLYALIDGKYSYKFDGEDLLTFVVWDVKIDTEGSDKYLGISTENGVDVIKNPLKIIYKITDVPEVILSSVTMKIYDSSGSEIRTIELDKTALGKQSTTWDGKDGSGQIVIPGDYEIEIEAVVTDGTVTDSFEVTVFKVEITTSCESLAAPYTCVDSFIANHTGTGDTITATTEPNTAANSAQWTCTDSPGGIDSGTCNPATGNGVTFTFIPNPPPAPNGRTGHLHYTIDASVTANSQTAIGTVIITQDELDQLRQEYHDMEKANKPERIKFVNTQNYQDPGYFSFDEINWGFYTWTIFTIAQNLENIRADIGNQAMQVSSGYRNPRRQLEVNPNAPESRHLYGDAADVYILNKDYNGDGIVGDRDDWYVLANAAKSRGACIEPYAMTISWIHMDWRGACPLGW